jgi:putative PIN family toxin of toxin-antitoxin system
VRAVLDTNVVVSGLFFGGVPRAILDLVAEGAFELVFSPAILDEYQRTYARLATRHPELQARPPVLDLLAYGTFVPDRDEEATITRDPDDDKFLLCARDARAVVVSGDRDLLDASGWAGVQVLTPRAFLDHLTTKGT